MLKKIISFIIMGCLQAGLILLGWGFNDISGFFKHPVRTIAVVSIMLMMLISAFVMEKTETKFARKGKKKVSKEIITGVILPTIFTMMILLISPYADRHNFFALSHNDFLRYLGLAVFFIGAIFSVWGPAHLGKQFSMGVTIQKEHKLITSLDSHVSFLT